MVVGKGTFDCGWISVRFLLGGFGNGGIIIIRAREEKKK